MRPDTDVAVVGAGIVGLACAAALARRGRQVVALERHGGIARETTSRNSEVVHAGIYYPPGTWKARLCVDGRERLYARCARLGIAHRRCGKLVVATDPGEEAALEALRARGEENGVAGLELRSAREVARMEPHVRARAALWVPVSGVVDAVALARSFEAEAEDHGAAVVLHAAVEGLERTASGWQLRLRDADGEPALLGAGAVVNAAGLEADRIAALAGIDVDASGYRIHPCKGSYFALAPGAPVRVSRLVYPVPPTTGLGIHATVDVAGRIRFGPDAEYVDAPDLRVDPSRAGAFAEAVRRYLPRMEARWLVPDQAGLRPRLAAPGERFRDFVVAEESARGLPGLVNLVGIESPGLTAAPALAEVVADWLAPHA